MFKIQMQTLENYKMVLYGNGRLVSLEQISSNLGVSDIQTTLFRGKLTTCFAGKEMQQML